MNFFTRAFVSITRNFGKTILLLLIVFALGCVISGAISVQQAVRNTDINLRAGMPVVATIDQDFEAIQESAAMGQLPEVISGLGPQLLDEIGSLQQVRRFDYFIEATLLSAELELVVPSDGAPVHFEEMGEEWTPLILRGVRSPTFLELEANLIEITYGRTLSAEEVGSLSLVAMVSESFAQVNNLAVGSIVTLQNIAWDKRGHESSGSDLYTEDNIFARQSYDFEIVGIFTSLVDYNTGSEFMDGIFQNQAENRIYVPNAVSAQANLFQLAQMGEMEPDVRYWQENTEDLLLYENIYLLHDFAEMNSFRQEAEKMLPDFYTVVNATDSYTNITSSMEPLSNLATTAMWAIAIVAVLILSLLITLSLHNRKHEIGTLLALGEKRRKIVLQMMFEVLAIAVLAIALSLFVGNLFATGISESMLRTNLVATQSGDEYMYFNTLDYLGFSNNVSADDVLASYDTSLDTATILTFFAVSIGTVIVATIVPMLYILRLNPRKIMM